VRIPSWTPSRLSLSLFCSHRVPSHDQYRTNRSIMVWVRTIWVTTQRIVVISYRRFGTTNRFHPRGSRIQRKACGSNTEFVHGRVLGLQALLNSWALRMGTTGCLQTSLRNCQYSVRNNLEERSSQRLRGASLKSNKVV
jgi:hypothetical protein